MMLMCKTWSWAFAYHDGFQPLANSPLALFAVFDFLPQDSRLLLQALHLGLGLLAPQHGSLKRRIGALALQLPGLHAHAEAVKLADLVVHRAVAASVSGWRANAGKDVAALVHAVGRCHLEGSTSGRGGVGLRRKLFHLPVDAVWQAVGVCVAAASNYIALRPGPSTGSGASQASFCAPAGWMW